jgi:hypothetical protein
MAGLSDYAEDKLVDHLLGTSAFTAPSAVYLALFSDDPQDDASGTELTGEPGYARQEITFGASSGGTASNSSAETYTSSSGDWPTVTHFAVFDALTTGNMLVRGEFGSGIVIGEAGHTFGVGDIRVTGA